MTPPVRPRRYDTAGYGLPVVKEWHPGPAGSVRSPQACFSNSGHTASSVAVPPNGAPRRRLPLNLITGAMLDPDQPSFSISDCDPVDTSTPQPDDPFAVSRRNESYRSGSVSDGRHSCSTGAHRGGTMRDSTMRDSTIRGSTMPHCPTSSPGNTGRPERVMRRVE